MRLYRIGLEIEPAKAAFKMEPKLERAEDVERELILLRLAFKEQKRCKTCGTTANGCEGCNLNDVDTYLKVLEEDSKDKTIDELNNLL